MKGTDGQFSHRAVGQLVQPLHHLSGGLIGKGNRHNVTGTDLADLNQIGYPVSNDPGLAAARPGQNQHWPTNRLHSFSLRGVKLDQDVHRLIIAFHRVAVLPEPVAKLRFQKNKVIPYE